MAIFKNYGERLPIMEKLRQQLINDGLLNEECKDKSIANNGYGCRLSHDHGLPFYVFIGISTDENGDYAFLRFWLNENKKSCKKRIKKRQSFLENNAKEIHNCLGKKDIYYYSYKKHQVNGFKITDDDSFDEGFIAYYNYRESKNELWNDLIRMSKVLRLIMENERMPHQQLKQPKETIPDIDAENIIERPCFQKKKVPHKLFLTNEAPKDSGCREVIIVGPYPTEGFVRRVKEEMKPQKEIYVIVDSSWKEDEIENIKKIEGVTVRKVQTNRCGIVHAKMYYVKYSNGKVQLFFGSVNASENSIENNSEFISSYWLHSFNDKDDNDKNKIETYFTNLKEGKDVKSLEITLECAKKQYSTLFFPEIQAYNGDCGNSFKNWLRKGYFFIKYDSDPNLGVYPINVKDNKIPRSEIKELLKDTPLAKEKVSQKMQIPYPYAKVGVSRSDNNKDHWKSNYGVSTEMGCWISFECLKELNEKIPPSNISREKIVKNILEFENAGDEGASFYEAISKKKKLMNILALPSKNKFLERLEEKIASDKLLIQDKAYRSRYLTGYAKIPASILNEDYLDKIIDDFIDSYKIKFLKGKMGFLVTKLASLQKLPKEEKINILEELWKQDKSLFVNYYKKGPPK